MKTLAIIGNGFDLACKLPSSLNEFAKFVEKNDSQVYDTVEQFLPVQGNWCDLESALAYFDTESALQESAEYLVGYGADDWSDAYHHSVQFNANRIAEALSTNLRKLLAKWALSLDTCPVRIPSSVSFVKDTRFLNFNYTCTLQRAFGVQESNIMHIHGQAQRGDGLILGHAMPEATSRPLYSAYHNEDSDVRIREAADIIDGILNDTAKRSEMIIKDNTTFFLSLAPIENIYVLGHSFEDVDYPYFEKVKKCVSEDTNWHVTTYSEQDYERADGVRNLLGIPNTKWSYFKL